MPPTAGTLGWALADWVEAEAPRAPWTCRFDKGAVSLKAAVQNIKIRVVLHNFSRADPLA